jgi:hypothetical protein
VSIAYVEDKKAPYSTPGRAKRQTALKKGGTIGGYVLREIEQNRIVLVRGEDRLVVMLDEKRKRMGDEKAASSPFKGPIGAFPPTSIAPAAPQVTVPSPGAAISIPPVQGADNQGTGSPALTRSQRLEAIRNLKSQRGATPP